MPRPAFRSIGSVAPGSTNSLAIPVPSETAEGDLLIVCIHRVAQTGAITPPASPGTWTSVTTVTNTDHMQMFWKAAGASESGTYTFTWTTAAVATGVCMAYTGCATTDPIDDISATTTTGTTTAKGTNTPNYIYDMMVVCAFNVTGGDWDPPRQNLSDYSNDDKFAAPGDTKWNKRYDVSGRFTCADLLNYGRADYNCWTATRCAGSGANGQIFVLIKPDPTWRTSLTTTEAIQWHDTWKYSDAATDLGYLSGSPAFYENSFNYSAWSTGTPPFGYGSVTFESDETDADTWWGGSWTTALTQNSGDNRTAFFKRTFSVTDRTLVAGCRLGLVCDDAAAVWINGVLVQHVRMPDNPPNSWFWGMDETSDGIVVSYNEDEGRVTPHGLSDTEITSTVLVNGDNQIAVALFSATPGSSDRHCGMRVILDTVPAPAGVTIPLVMHHRKQQG